jgi:hypothetical protein
MSMGTGIAVLAVTDRGTLRASRWTAEVSDALRKMGPVIVGGSRVPATDESCTGAPAMMAFSLNA